MPKAAGRGGGRRPGSGEEGDTRGQGGETAEAVGVGVRVGGADPAPKWG